MNLRRPKKHRAAMAAQTLFFSVAFFSAFLVVGFVFAGGPQTTALAKDVPSFSQVVCGREPGGGDAGTAWGFLVGL